MPKHVGFRAVHGDLSSSRGYRWPYPGEIATAPGPIVKSNKGGCPSSAGDGICIAKTWEGAASGGIPALTCLIVEYYDGDVLGEDANKVRVSRARVVEIIDVPLLARAGYLTGANLTRVDLYGADLYGADLYGADLTGADLTGANLTRANLTRANLTRANLYGANLSGADLYGADLYGANLSGADRVPSGWKRGAGGLLERS